MGILRILKNIKKMKAQNLMTLILFFSVLTPVLNIHVSDKRDPNAVIKHNKDFYRDDETFFSKEKDLEDDIIEIMPPIDPETGPGDTIGGKKIGGNKLGGKIKNVGKNGSLNRVDKNKSLLENQSGPPMKKGENESTTNMSESLPKGNISDGGNNLSMADPLNESETMENVSSTTSINLFKQRVLSTVLKEVQLTSQ